MKAGRIEQLGSPQEVYEEPRSEFVARFLGGSNIIRGKALDTTRLSIAGTIIECHGAPFVRGSDGAAAIRQHDIKILPSQPRPADANAVQGTVARNVFLGARATYRRARDGTTAARHGGPGGELRTGHAKCG